MNRAKLKAYAPQARKDFLRAVSDRARKVGLTLGHFETVEVRGDIAIIAGQAFPKRVAEQRRGLDEQIKRKGFADVMEEAAYTWFNRLMAIRFMELHDGYLEHGYRILSHPSGKAYPQILEHAEKVALPGVDSNRVLELRRDGTQDEELYRIMLLGQCHALHLAMPFLFERIDDQTELLLPDNLLTSDSVVRKMVTDIEEADWERIEIIGWLYQFYISEEKDELMAAKKAYASEDIPAVTQLFTPNWIVKYMVQNSLGRQWLATYPQSSLRAQMEYYIEPAEQIEDVKAQLAAITPVDLDPETITLIDPACGSGHILVEAYDLFKAIYLERGYRMRDVPRLILEKNLFGLEIDDRAEQMAGFALLMKARADDRRILDQPPTLNILCIRSSEGLRASEMATALLPLSNRESNGKPPLLAQDIIELVSLFSEAKAVGSLITIPPRIKSKMSQFRSLVDSKSMIGDLLAENAVQSLKMLVTQAEFLAREYGVSVMNPPYLGVKGMNTELKHFAAKNYPSSKSDLFAMFIERCISFATHNGYVAMVTMQSWMFLSSYEILRKKILKNKIFATLAHLGPDAFPEIRGDIVQVATFVFQDVVCNQYIPTFIQATDGNEEAKSLVLRSGLNRYDCVKQAEFDRIPGSPIAYWASERDFDLFGLTNIDAKFIAKKGMALGENARFLRMWHEVSFSSIRFDATSNRDTLSATWYPCLNGGEFRKWYGNNSHVVLWKGNGAAPKARITERTGDGWQRYIISTDYFFRAGITWTAISSSSIGARAFPVGFCFTTASMCLFGQDIEIALALINSKVGQHFLTILTPTLNFGIGEVKKIPYVQVNVVENTRMLVKISMNDWDSTEQSWAFQRSPLLERGKTLEHALSNWNNHISSERERLKYLEEDNNRLLIESYGLKAEITPEVSYSQINLTIPTQLNEIQRLVSYAVGCILGRFSLDEPGIIYALSNSDNFDPSRYSKCPVSNDGILSVTDSDWFGDKDIVNRLSEFIRMAFPTEIHRDNMKFIGDTLATKIDEPPLASIRQYLTAGFYKNHLQVYKNRLIYWLFSSGKERAFQALVYLHRYNEGTLARMRMDYVVPLQSRMSARIDQLDKDIASSTSTADRKKRQSERDKLSRQYLELLNFDEKLRHYADQRISLDLDDGVKVNYGKFGDLLAEVKTITGDKDE